MKQLALTLLLIVGSSSCGDGAGSGKPIADKGQAADASYGLVTAKQGIEGKTGRALSPKQLGGDGLDVGADVTVQGESGSARISAETQINEGQVRVRYHVVFDGYSPDGINSYDGDLTYLTEVVTGDASVSVIEEVKGTASIRGEYSADLDLDARLAIRVDAGSVSIQIEGTITADGSTFTYDGEVVDIHTDGTIDVDVSVDDDPNPDDEPNPDDDPPVGLEACEGSYEGTYSGTASGRVEGVFSNGTFQVTFASDLGDEINLQYDVAADGSIEGSSFGISLDASIEADGCRIGGLWSDNVGGGTWSAVKLNR